MSKVEELREKFFSKMSNSDFDFFNESDTTPTKKYLEYMLKAWVKRHYGNVTVTKKKIVKAVFEFDELINFITNKDIYAKEYTFERLLDIIESAKALKEEVTFDRTKENVILDETEDYIFLSPLTFKSSLKYGASTKWCTASKNNQQMFTSYSKECLVYLIDKKLTKRNNFNKVAFYSQLNQGFNTGYYIYSETDKTSSIETMIENGWDKDLVFKLDYLFRTYKYHKYNLKKVKDDVNKVVNFMRNIDFNEFNENLKKLQINSTFDGEQIKVTFESFYEKIRNLEKSYGV